MSHLPNGRSSPRGTETDLEARKRLLELSGLTVVDPAWSGPALESMAAWRLLILYNIVPTATVRISKHAAHLPEAKLEKLAWEAGILDSEDGFLISVEGIGAESAPWALVKPNPPLNLASRLGLDYGDPECKLRLGYERPA